MKRIFILLFLLPLLSKAQVYQAMPQAGYGPVKRMIFDSVLSVPLGITKVQNITGGRDTGQLRYNKADSSLYTYSGNAFRKVSGTGGSTDTTSLSNRINAKLSLSGGTMTGNIITGDPDNDNGNTIGDNFIFTTNLSAYTPENNTPLTAFSNGGNHAQFGGDKAIINNAGKFTSVDSLEGKAIKRTSGTSAQYLMANGSISTVGSGLSLSGGVLSNTATTGITAINSLTGATQTMVTGTDSSDFKIVSTGTQHKFNVPDASTTARGVITTGAQTMAGNKTFTAGNQVPGFGAIGISDNDDTENNYAGIKGEGLQVSKGVWGTAVNNYALYGTSTNSAGIVAKTSAGSYHAVLGDFDNNSTYITKSGRVLIKTQTDNTLDALQVNGNIKANNTRYIIKSAGATNSTTTLATFDLNTPSLTAGTYRFSILIAYSAATTGTGARFVIDGNGTTPTSLNFSMIRTLTATTQVANFESAYLTPATATTTSLTLGNVCKIEGVITLPSTAVLSVKFASETAASAITVLTGSYFEYF